MHTQADGGPALIAVVPLGLACCSVEVAVAVDDALPRGWVVSDDPAVVGAAAARILVVAGTVSEASVPVVTGRWAALADPRAAVSFGACSTSGGPYWDSYAVTMGVDQFLPVAAYVPGCPPRPQLLLDALHDVATTLLGGASRRGGVGDAGGDLRPAGEGVSTGGVA